MILLVTNRRDLTTDYIVLELQRRGLAYARLNTEMLPQSDLRLGFSASTDWSIRMDGLNISGPEVRAAYFRRPGGPIVDPAVEEAELRDYCAGEWGASLKSLYQRLGPHWLNAPAAIMLAEDKPRQLLSALDLGFKVPETLVTNGFEAATAFLQRGRSIAKPLKEALIAGEDEAVIFTTRVETLIERDKRAFEVAPMILQREVAKRADVRVTVVGDQVFAAAISSQQNPDTIVDWRRGSVVELPHDRLELPSDLMQRCVRLTRSLDLGYGAIDLVLDEDGAFWFLEINPNGQWAWIENRTGYPIAAALVDELVRISER